MKWNAPKTGDVRILTKFAILPITCKVRGENIRETRWLCFVKIRQSYTGIEWYNDWFE
jgi:hypothetical protein